MARPWRVRYAGAKYHVTVRGNGRQAIFLSDADHARFLEQLTRALEQDGVILYAFVLMPNHYHLLLETPHGNIQRFMQRLNTSYSLYFRYRHGRPGHCFQGRYGAKLAEGDDYLLRLTRYIHLNPVKTRGMDGRTAEEKAAHLAAYPWSSLPGYVSGKHALTYVDYRWLHLMGRPTAGGTRRAYSRYIAQMLGACDDLLLREKAASRYAIGDERFREQVEEDLKAVRTQKGVCGDIVWPVARGRAMAEVASAVAADFGVSVERLKTHGNRAGVAKQVAIELCCRLSCASQREIGRHFGYAGNGAAGKQRRTLAWLLQHDPRLARRVQRLEGALKKP